MKIHIGWWIVVYLIGIVTSWNNIYSLRFLGIMWGICVLIYTFYVKEYTEDIEEVNEDYSYDEDGEII